MNTNEKAKYGVRKVAKITLEFPEPPVGGRPAGWTDADRSDCRDAGGQFGGQISRSAAFIVGGVGLHTIGVSHHDYVTR